MTRPLVALLVAALTGLTGCMGDDEPAETSRDALEQQRVDVRAVATRTLAAVEEGLTGRRTQAGGRFQGCRSGGIDRFESFQYRYDARVDAGATATRPYLAGLDAELGEVTDENGASVLRGTRDGVEVSVVERPAAGDFVLVQLSGPCLEVSADDSDYWLRRDADNEPLG